MTNDEAREHFKESGLTYAMIGSKEFIGLIDILKTRIERGDNNIQLSVAELTKKTSGNGSFFVCDLETGGISEAYIRLNANYFEGREGISFNKNGFIGFAGWADCKHTEIITEAFKTWCNLLRGRK